MGVETVKKILAIASVATACALLAGCSSDKADEIYAKLEGQTQEMQSLGVEDVYGDGLTDDLLPEGVLVALSRTALAAFDLNLYDAPSPIGSVVGTVPEGAQVRVTGVVRRLDGSRWYAVTYDSAAGYACGGLDFSGVADRTDATPSPEPAVDPDAILSPEPTVDPDATPSPETTDPDSRPPAEVRLHAEATAQKDNVRLRAQPSTQGRVVDTVDRDTVLSIVSCVSMPDGDWYVISWQGDKAYVRGDLIALSNKASDLPRNTAIPIITPAPDIASVPETTAMQDGTPAQIGRAHV